MRLSRRQVVQGMGAVGVGLLAGCGRLPWQTQPPRVYRVGWLHYESSPTWYEAFRQGMRDQGYVEGENLLLEARSGGGQRQHLSTLAAELARLPLDVVVAVTPADVAAMRDAANAMPIVFGIAADPVEQRLVASLARPGGQVTGLTVMASHLTGKRVELLDATVPGLARLAVLAMAEPSTGLNADEAAAAARALGIEPLALEIHSSEAIPGLFDTAAHARAGAVVALAGTRQYAPRIIEQAAEHRLPAMYPQRDFVEAGGLMSYGPDYLYNFRRIAVFVDKILKGTQPSELPVEQPMRFDFVINLRTAQALGLTIPQHVLLQATEVLQ
jgi:putative tryptophan/tyrosine transport system substrate-binding protein